MPNRNTIHGSFPPVDYTKHRQGAGSLASQPQGVVPFISVSSVVFMGNPTGLPLEKLACKTNVPTLFHNCLFKSIQREKIMVYRLSKRFAPLPLRIRKSSATEPFFFPALRKTLKKICIICKICKNRPIFRVNCR